MLPFFRKKIRWRLARAYQDEEVIVDLMSMGMTMFHYNNELPSRKADIREMLELLQVEIGQKEQ